jgi:DNA-binding winged helix-turn-helix (wHTH) protein
MINDKRRTTNYRQLPANNQMDCTPIESAGQLRRGGGWLSISLSEAIHCILGKGNTMVDLAAGSKRRRPHVIVIAAERVAARWAQALAAERVMCLVASDLTVAARLLAEETQVELLIIDRVLLNQQPRALLNVLSSTGHWPVIVPVKTSSVRPTVADRKRIAAALALIRPKRTVDHRLKIGELVIDPERKRARVKNKHWVSLPPVQYQLLFVMAQHAGKVIGYQQLLREVWGYDGSPSEAQELLKAHVRLLRRKLGLNPQTGEYIQSVRGHGYMLAAPDS